MNNSKTFFMVFMYVSFVNMERKSDYYLSTDIVQDIEFNDGKLVVTTRDDMKAVCAKQTKTEPEKDSLCWVNTIDSKSTISIYEYKTYHIWTKDSSGVINYYSEYNTNGNM